MTAYIILAVFPVVLGLFFPNIKEKRQERIMYFVICGAIMLLIMGCRHYTLGSVDTLHYYYRMEYAIECDNWNEFYDADLYEAGFQLFVFLLSRVFNHPQWLLVISSLFYIIAIFYFIDRNSEEISLSITLYISLGLMIFHLQGMRQALAICICLFAYEQAKKNNFFKFSLAVFLAVLFHQTAIVFIPIYWLAKLKLNTVNVFLVSSISILAILFSTQLVDIANMIFSEEYSGTVDSGGLVAVLIYIIGLGVCCLYYSSHNNDKLSPLVFVMIIGGASYLIRYTGVLIAERISFYFSFSQIALIPCAKKLLEKKARFLIHIIIVGLAIGLFMYRLKDSGFLPYMFFWE